MFNEKIWERAREIVSRGDVTELTTRVYKQIVAESKLYRLEKEQSNTASTRTSGDAPASDEVSPL